MNELIKLLYNNPERFNKLGLGCDLLQFYFDGLDLNTLDRLLKDENTLINKTAVWITSELGIQAKPIVESVIPLLDIDDRYLKYYALECIAVCAVEDKSHLDDYLVKHLNDSDKVIADLCQFLLSNKHSG